MLTHTLGFPRIGLHRELKRALEAYWAGARDDEHLLTSARERRSASVFEFVKPEEALFACAHELRSHHWRLQQAAGVDLIPVGDFSLYDHVLDTVCMLGAVPERFEWRSDLNHVDLPTYLRMARGEGGVLPMEMSKWFDTNYHYIVPEFHPEQTFRLASTQILDHVREAKEQGIRAKAVLLGPLTFLKLGKPTVENFDPLDHMEAILAVYEQVLKRLAGQVEWIQIDEPVLVLDLTEKEQLLFRLASERLIKAASPAKILLATYFGALSENTSLTCMPPVATIHVDLVRAPNQLDHILETIAEDQVLSLGVVNGRNVWRADADAALATIDRAAKAIGHERLMIGTSCSLLHTPIDLEPETGLDPEIRSWLAFAKQKCGELRMLADAASGASTDSVLASLEENRDAWRSRRISQRVTNPSVRERLAQVTDEAMRRRSPYERRKAIQQVRLNLPLLPTTTIGSFPQTDEIRAARRRFKVGKIGVAEYTAAMHGFIR